MKSHHEQYLIVLNRMIKKEVDELTELIDILSDDASLVTTDTKSKDVMVMEARKTSFDSIKGMIKKASIQVVGVDKEVIMSKDEKKVFYKLVKFIMFFRKLFGKSK